jgi:putative heme-binding domain-containing protein
MPKYKKEIGELFPAPNALGGQALPTIPQLVALKGNAAHGKELFERETTSCITCHRVGPIGADFGPALSEIGTKLGRDAIFESIIDPNAGIAMGFETTQLTLKDGSAAVGIVRSETADDLILAMPRGIQVPYKKSEIAAREKLPNSMMPSGLNQVLSVQDLVDLVEYLSTLKAPTHAAR